MSRQIGLDTINLKAVSRIAHTEFADSPALIKAVTGEYSGTFEDRVIVEL